MTQMKTQTILPPISRKNDPLMNAKSAPLTPRSTKTSTNGKTTTQKVTADTTNLQATFTIKNVKIGLN